MSKANLPLSTLNATYVTHAATSSRFALSSLAWQGLYARTQPVVNVPGGHTGTYRPVAVDPNFSGVNGTGRLWGVSNAHGYIVFTDDDGVNGTATTANPTTDAVPSGVVGMYFATDSSANKWVFLVTGTSASVPSSGEIWRSPAPSATGTGLVWTCVWRANGLALGPGSSAAFAPVNSTMRNGSFAVDPSGHAFALTYGSPNATQQFPTLSDGIMRAGSNRLTSLGTKFSASMIGQVVTVSGAGAAGSTYTGTITSIEYTCQNIAVLNTPAATDSSAATITFTNTTLGAGVCVGGPAIYHSANIFTATAGSVTWTLSKQWPQAKHGHAVKIIGGYPWVSLGDMGGTAQPYIQFPDIGISRATSLTSPTVWSNPGVAGSGGSGTTRDVISFFPVTFNGKTVIVGESDGSINDGPLVFPSAAPGVSAAVTALHQIPFVYGQTMRSMGLTPENNLIWAGVSENGAHGTADSLWMSAPPFDTPHLLEDVNSATLISSQILSDAVISNGYWWAGTYRIAYDKLIGQ
ncbi:MAG: hypothetical protein ABIQ04_00150 [Candidatus Saccharimonadales bacterium]